MKIVGLLSWYDEEPEWLAECVTRAAGLVDHLVAVDGPYARFPGAAQKPHSPSEQADAIVHGAASVGLPVTLHLPREPWQSEVAKRDFMFRLAEPLNVDWLLRIDADEFVTDVPADFRERLARTDRHVVEFLLWQREYPSIPSFLRCLFRALPGIQVVYAHSLVACVVEGRRLLLAGDPATYRLEPAEQMHDVRIEHRRLQRPLSRQQRKDAYYQIMPQLEPAASFT